MSPRLPLAKAALRRLQAPRVPEKTVQSHIEQLLRSIGGMVYSIGTHRRSTDYQGTMQSPGIPDLLAFLPPRRFADNSVRPVLLFVECKAAGGRLRPEQQVFKALCQDATVEHVVGDLDAVIAWLVAHRYVKAESFSHYRQPARTE